MYHYLIRPESLSHNNKILSKRYLDKIEMYKQRAEYIRNLFPTLEELAIFNFQNFCYLEYINISLNYSQYDINGTIRHELHHQFCRSGPIKFQDINIFRLKLYRILFKLYPSFFIRIYVFITKFRLIKKVLQKAILI